MSNHPARRSQYEPEHSRSTRSRVVEWNMCSCACGCGLPTSRVTHTDRRRSVVKGEFHRYRRGHNAQQDLATRFWSKVVRRDGCWEWRGTLNPNGYGMLNVEHKNRWAHRVSWELANGPVPAGLFVCHQCDNPRCVRVDHLFLGSHADNMADMRAKGRESHRALGGEEHYAMKVTPAMSDDIVRLFDSGRLSKADLARRFGVSHRTIRHVLDGTHYTRRAA